MRNVRVFEVELSDAVASIYRPLLRAQGISGRAETRISRKVREELRSALKDMLVRSYADGSAPFRTGRSRQIMFNGIRAFGANFNSLRGYIVGPDYIRAHNEGATITPKRSRALTIPLPAAQRADGSPKLPSARSWQNVLRTFIYKSKRTGQAYIAYKNSAGELTLLYLLVDEAQLRKYQGFLDRAWDLQKPDILQAFGQALLLKWAK